MYRFSIGQICCHREALPFFFTYPIASLIVVKSLWDRQNKGKKSCDMSCSCQVRVPSIKSCPDIAYATTDGDTVNFEAPRNIARNVPSLPTSASKAA